MPANSLRLLILGAHPDDAEFHAGGLATIYRQQGHVVKMVSVTDGRSGHHRYQPAELARVRRAEATAAGALIGAEYETWDYPDGTLQPTLDVREKVIRAIRGFAPDLVLTHRPNDYHPDHRAVGQAVQDASYMVTVPLVVPDVPILARDPVVAYMPDLFTRPYPLGGRCRDRHHGPAGHDHLDARLPSVSGVRIPPLQPGDCRPGARRSPRTVGAGCETGM